MKVSVKFRKEEVSISTANCRADFLIHEKTEAWRGDSLKSLAALNLQSLSFEGWDRVCSGILALLSWK